MMGLIHKRIRMQGDPDKIVVGQGIYWASVAITLFLEYAAYFGMVPMLSFGGKVVLTYNQILSYVPLRTYYFCMIIATICVAAYGLAYSLFELKDIE